MELQKLRQAYLPRVVYKRFVTLSVQSRRRPRSSSSASTFRFSKLRTEFDKEEMESLYRRYFFHRNRSSLVALLGSLSAVASVFFLLSLIQDRVSTVEKIASLSGL